MRVLQADSHLNTMGDNNTESKTGMSKKWITPYSRISQADAEKRLGFRMGSLKALAVGSMLAEAGYTPEQVDSDAVLKTKEEVYRQIVQYLGIEGYPLEADTDFKKANVSDLVYATIHPILFNFTRKTQRNIRLQKEKEIASVDSETGGAGEYVVVDSISVTKEMFVFVIEAKRSLGKAMRKCLLEMKDMRDNNGGGKVYGFVTTGETWRMLRYDGTSFQLSERIDVMFETMGQDQERWMKDYSALVDCMFVALTNGGGLKMLAMKNVVV
jgi:hypothetical protein